MGETEQQSLVLILARELADNLATPLFLVDRQGDVLFYNEPAEVVLGRSFAEAATMSRTEWVEAFPTQDLEGRTLGLRELPLIRTLIDRRPHRRRVCLRALDGAERTLTVHAYPLLARTEELLGAMAFFWEETRSEGEG